MKVKMSIGEIVDKATILSIKQERIEDKEKLNNIKKELMYIIRKLWEKFEITEATPLFQRLKAVNEALWDIEDGIREKEAKGEFDEEFIKIARSVYYTNEDRMKIKKLIDREYGSEFTEEKHYSKYKDEDCNITF